MPIVWYNKSITNNIPTKGNKTMRVSELQPAAYPQSPSVELPRSDAYRLFTNDFNKNSFIEEYGDVEIVWNERYKHWEVPAFAESRAVYCEAKSKAVARWGSN